MKRFLVTEPSEGEWPAPEVDSGGYPTDEFLSKLAAWNPNTADTKTWLLNDFKSFCEQASCASYNLEYDEGWQHDRLYFSTGGWSGNEDVIDIVWNWVAVRWMFQWAWRRGGHFQFDMGLPEQPPEGEGAEK